MQKGVREGKKKGGYRKRLVGISGGVVRKDWG